MRPYSSIAVPLLFILIVLSSGCVSDSVLSEDDLEPNQIVSVTEYTSAYLVGNTMQGHAYQIQLVNGSEYSISKTEYTGLGAPEASVERDEGFNVTDSFVQSNLEVDHHESSGINRYIVIDRDYCFHNQTKVEYTKC